MPTTVIMPALGMAQETGMLVRWLRSEGASVKEGEAIAEIMTDKATVELEAPATGTLAQILARPGAEVPVGQAIAVVLAPGDAPPSTHESDLDPVAASSAVTSHEALSGGAHADRVALPASPLAVRLATEHRLDLAEVPAHGKRIEKADVLAFLATRESAGVGVASQGARLTPASPKARRLAAEMGRELRAISGSGPHRAVLAADVLAHAEMHASTEQATLTVPASSALAGPSISHIWRLMAERTTQSWTQVPHFVLVREVNASRLIAWRDSLRQQGTGDVTYTDLLVKLVAATLGRHTRLNSSWSQGTLVTHDQINIGIAVAVDEGLVVPVVHHADQLSLSEIAVRRTDLVARAQASRLRPHDLSGATFTISNLGMYGVDAFNAIIVSPQAAILAMGRIAERVVPVNGAPGVQPMLTLTLSCDHRAIDGARGARFLGALAAMIEEPLTLFQ